MQTGTEKDENKIGKGQLNAPYVIVSILQSTLSVDCCSSCSVNERNSSMIVISFGPLEKPALEIQFTSKND